MAIQVMQSLESKLSADGCGCACCSDAEVHVATCYVATDAAGMVMMLLVPRPGCNKHNWHLLNGNALSGTNLQRAIQGKKR